MTSKNEKAYNLLKNSIKKNSISHFYIFHGPNNVGKKKLAYSFSKLLLCENQDIEKPCSECDSCSKIDEKKHFDIVFIDSNSKIFLVKFTKKYFLHISLYIALQP